MDIIKDLLLISLFLLMTLHYVLLYKNFIKQRNYFIDTLSHDLRVSAIAQIRGLELIEKGEHLELLDDVKNSCRFTLEMINTLLNTYKYTKKENVINYETFFIEDSIADTYKHLYQKIKDKNIDIVNNMYYRKPIIADRSGIDKVFYILLSTAIFNAKNCSSINIATKKTFNNIEIKISYIGKPLSEEETNRMFFKNPQFSTVGHGIKMHLCKKIIDFHKGKIYAKNEGNGNNSFSFVLPIKVSKSNRYKTLLIPALQPHKL